MKRAFFYIIIGYLSGSILFTRVAERLFHRKGTIEESSDKNPGAFNAFRYGGFRCGLLTLCGDLLKGVLPVGLYLAGSGVPRGMTRGCLW